MGEGGYIACIDYDTKNVTEEAKQLGKKILDQLRITRIEETVNKGLHYLYISREEVDNDLTHHDEVGLELLAKDRLIIMAPSEGYTTLNDNPLTIIQNLESIFNNLLEKEGVTARRKINLFDRTTLEGYGGVHPSCIAKILKGTKEGERNESAVRLSAYLLNFRGEPNISVWKQLLDWNQTNENVLDEGELRNVLESVSKNQYLYTCSDELLKRFCDGKETCPLFMKKVELELEEKAKQYEAFTWKERTDELLIEELLDTLSTEIKFDDTSKSIIFLTFVLAYTDELQQNSDMTGPPSIGKTYTVKCIADYFPNIDNMFFMGATPKMFFYDDKIRQQFVLVNNDLDNPIFNKIDWDRQPEKGEGKEVWDGWNAYTRKFVWIQDLERKNLIFLDMPDFKLLANLRSTLSHDKKLSRYSTVNKNTMRTDHIYIKGFFSCIFCTCFSRPNVQEIHRFWHLNPEWSEKKEKAVLDLIDKKDQDPDFRLWLENHKQRLWLKVRVRDIKKFHINEIYIPEELNKKMRIWFDSKYSRNVPKKSRDYPRFKALAKGWALLNCHKRKIEIKNGKKILWCKDVDFDIAKQIYGPIARAAEFGMSIEELEVFEKIVKPLLTESEGTTIRDFHRNYLGEYKRQISDGRLKGFLRKFTDMGHCIELNQGRGKPKLYFAIPKEAGTKIDVTIQEKHKLTIGEKAEVIMDLVREAGVITMKDIIEKDLPNIMDFEIPKIVNKLCEEGILYQPHGEYYSLVQKNL